MSIPSSVTVLPTSASVRSAIAQAFPFSVDKFPLYGPDRMPTPHYGLFRSDSLECVGTACKRGYEPHTLDDVQALAEAAAVAFEGEDCKLSAKFMGGHRLILGPARGYLRTVSGRDTVAPRLIVKAGYDGSAFNAWFGVYRGVCENLTILRPHGVGVHGSIRHTRALRDRVPQLIQQFRALAGSYDGVVSAAQKMAETEVSLRDWLRTVYPQAETATARTRGAADRRAFSIASRIQRERLQLGVVDYSADLDRVTAWEAFNAFQGFAQHDANRHGQPDRVTRALVALDDQAVERAHGLALAAIAA